MPQLWLPKCIVNHVMRHCESMFVLWKALNLILLTYRSMCKFCRKINPLCSITQNQCLYIPLIPWINLQTHKSSEIKPLKMIKIGEFKVKHNNLYACRWSMDWISSSMAFRGNAFGLSLFIVAIRFHTVWQFPQVKRNAVRREFRKESNKRGPGND